jgi:hypothetical protein
LLSYVPIPLTGSLIEPRPRFTRTSKGTHSPLRQGSVQTAIEGTELGVSVSTRAWPARFDTEADQAPFDVIFRGPFD